MWVYLETVIQGDMLHSDAGDFLLSYLSSSTSKTLSPKMCGFLSVWKFLLFFCMLMEACCSQDEWFPETWLLFPFLCFFSYLPTVTSSPTQSHWFLSPDASLSFPFLEDHCKTQNSGLRSKEEKPCDPINQPSRCNTQEGFFLSVAQTGDSDLLGGRAHRTANWASFICSMLHTGYKVIGYTFAKQSY